MVSRAPLILSRPYDVAILGAGPAGCAAAGLLAGWGRRVIVVERGDAGRHELGESLPPSCHAILEVVGMRDAVAAGGFVVATGNTAWWGDEAMRVEPFAGGRVGWQVERRALDAVLRGAAAAAGAEFLLPATALTVERRRGEPHVVHLEAAGERRALHAAWVLDCTGRSALLGRTGRQVASGPHGAVRTLALAGIWRRDGGWPVPDDSHTLVESVDHGWGWSIPLSPGRRYFTVMLDPARSRLAGGAPETRYAAELARLPHLGAVAAHGSFEGRAWAIDATPYRVEPVVEERLLLAGDAASFIDPLSSFGVKKALTSGWLAAVVANTALGDAAMAEPAQRLFAAREREYAASAARELAALARDAGGGDAGFWRARATLGEGATGEAREWGVDDGAVAAAFETLKGATPLRLHLAPDVAVVERPLVRGNVVAYEPHLSAPRFRVPLRYARNADLVAVARVATNGDDVGAMFERYREVVGPVALPDFLWAMSMLVAAGVLRLA